MKRFLVLLTAWLTAATTFTVIAGEKPRVAVFDPSTDNTVSNASKVMVRELIASALVNCGEYTILERSMLDRVMKESKFNNSAAVDESQATQLGKLAGANKVVLSVLTETGRKSMLSIKMIDVETAEVELQKAKVISSDEIFDEVEPLVMAMVGYTGTGAYSEAAPGQSVMGTKPVDMADLPYKAVREYDDSDFHEPEYYRKKAKTYRILGWTIGSVLTVVGVGLAVGLSGDAEDGGSETAFYSCCGAIVGAGIGSCIGFNVAAHRMTNKAKNLEMQVASLIQKDILAWGRGNALVASFDMFNVENTRTLGLGMKLTF